MYRGVNYPKAVILEGFKKIRPYLDDKKFGRGGFTEEFEVSGLSSILTLAFNMLWQNGCRVPAESLEKNQLSWMVERAVETNFLFSEVLARAKELNPSLYKELSEPRQRRSDESMPEGIYEPDSGPNDNDKYIYPMQGIFGYSAPRILSEIIGRREKGTTPTLFVNALELLDSVIEASSSRSARPSEFVARLTGRGFENGAGAIAMLSHIFPEGILREQNCFTDYRDLASDLSIHAPKVWSAYQDAHHDVLVMNGIAPMSRFISSG